MPISQSRYVNVTSGVAGAAAFPQRDLIGRIFSSSIYFPTGEVVEFNSFAEVQDYLGTAGGGLGSNNDLSRAAFYFGFISKTFNSPQKLGFQRYSAIDTAPLIFGSATGDFTVGDWTGITNGDFTLQMGATTTHLTGLNFSACVTLADVAAVIQAAIRAITGGGALWTAATVTYTTSNPKGSGFNLVGGATGAATIAVTAGTTNNVAGKLGWSFGAILSNGIVGQTFTAFLTQSVQKNNNFGSFEFNNDLSQTVNDHIEIAEWNDGQNNQFIYCTGPSEDDDTWTPSAASAALIDYSGVAMTLRPIGTQFPHILPMAILAATDYTQVNAVQNYMYQQASGLTPSVTDDSDADAYDALRVNYYGQTQSSGVLRSFYQRGIMTGDLNDATSMNVYANEIWLKAAAEDALLNLLLALPKISANKTGVGQVLAALQAVINQALLNGTISVGKTLTQQQILTINSLSGTSTAWPQVQNIGYWVNCVIVPVVNGSGATEYEAHYTLIYSKDDDINKIDGRHILI